MRRVFPHPIGPADAVDRRFLPLVGLFLGGGALNAIEALLVPRLKLAFRLDYAQALGVQLAYYAGYLFLAYPASALVARRGALRAIAVGTAAVAAGTLALAAALALRSSGTLVAGLLVASVGVTVLQIAGNSFVATGGDPRRGAARFTMLQGFNSLGTVVGPATAAGLLLGGGGGAAAWPFLVLAAGFAALSIAFRGGDAAAPAAAAIVPHPRQLVALLRTRATGGGAAAIFAYVGAEVTIGSLVPSYLMLAERGGWAAVAAGRAASVYWLGAMVGRFAGAWAMGRVGARRLLGIAAATALALVATAVLPTGAMGGAALLLVGLANSIMFPTIFAMAMPAAARQVPAAAMLLCVAVSGGAVVPALTGLLADRAGLAPALLLPGGCYAVVLAFGRAVGRRP